GRGQNVNIHQYSSAILSVEVFRRNSQASGVRRGWLRISTRMDSSSSSRVRDSTEDFTSSTVIRDMTSPQYQLFRFWKFRAAQAPPYRESTYDFIQRS